MKDKVVLAWSGGKDSALALHELRRSEHYDVVSLLTTVTDGYDRISMHGVRRVLLEQQARAVGLPLKQVVISQVSTNEEYEQKMRAALDEFQAQGISAVAFGDIFLEEVRKYREENMSRIGIQPIFPLWKRDPAELAHTFIALGFRGITSCVDSRVLDARFVGRFFDLAFLADLPAGIDPCGENGEFHSFAFDGPVFRQAVPYTKGEIVLRDNRFFYCDLIPVQ